MKPYIYPDMISELLEVCRRLLSGLASNDDLQRAVQRAEGTIIAIEEKDVRDYLTDIEGALELIKFTVEEGDQVIAGQKVASDLIRWIEGRAAS